MSIPEFSPATSNDYYENVFENKNLNCYNFNDKIPNLNSSLVDDNKCDKIVDNNSRFLGGFGYVALYQKDNEYQGLNFNSKDIILDNEYSFLDILQMREHMLFWYKTYDDNDKKFISRSATVNGREFTKIQQGYNNQKEYILKDYSGNENHATLSYIDYLGNYIVNKEFYKNHYMKKSIERQSNKTFNIEQNAKFISTEYNDYVLSNEVYDEFRAAGQRMEDDYGEIGGYKYNQNCKGWISYYYYENRDLTITQEDYHIKRNPSHVTIHRKLDFVDKKDSTNNSWHTWNIRREQKETTKSRFVSYYVTYYTASVDGNHTFYTRSDDGSILKIKKVGGRSSSRVIVNNDGVHANLTKKEIHYLEKDKVYKIEVFYFQNRGAASLQVKIKIPTDVTNPILEKDFSDARYLVGFIYQKKETITLQKEQDEVESPKL